MYFSSSFSIPLGGFPPLTDADGCWVGLPSPLEVVIQNPYPSAPLEQLRARFLHTVTTTHDPVQGARATLQMSLETEISSVLTKLLPSPVPPSVTQTKVCPRRHFLDVDTDMQQNSYLFQPALDALGGLASPVPPQYVTLLQRFLASNYPRYRVCAMATILVLAAILS